MVQEAENPQASVNGCPADKDINTLCFLKYAAPFNAEAKAWSDFMQIHPGSFGIERHSSNRAIPRFVPIRGSMMPGTQDSYNIERIAKEICNGI